MNLRAQNLPPAAGWQWLVGGFAIFRRNPPLLGLLVMCYWFTVLLLSVIPLVGTVAASLLIPGLSVGLMQACRSLERRQPIGLQTLFGSLRDNTGTLVALGALYLGCTLGILGLSTIADGGTLLQTMLSGKPVDRETLESGALLLPATIVVALLVPLLMAYWFAPVLAAWHRLPLFKALFFSFMACWINWRPFLVYGLALLLVGGIAPGILLGLLAGLIPAAASFISALVTIPVILVLVPVTFASFYVSYRDVFGISEIV